MGEIFPKYSNSPMDFLTMSFFTFYLHLFFSESVIQGILYTLMTSYIYFKITIYILVSYSIVSWKYNIFATIVPHVTIDNSVVNLCELWLWSKWKKSSAYIVILTKRFKCCS